MDSATMKMLSNMNVDDLAAMTMSPRCSLTSTEYTEVTSRHTISSGHTEVMIISMRLNFC